MAVIDRVAQMLFIAVSLTCTFLSTLLLSYDSQSKISIGNDGTGIVKSWDQQNSWDQHSDYLFDNQRAYVTGCYIDESLLTTPLTPCRIAV